MITRTLTLVCAVLLTCSAAHSQNVQNNNRGVIINVILTPAPEPLYMPSVPAYTGPNDVDRAMEKADREVKSREVDDFMLRMKAKSDSELAFSGEDSYIEMKRYENSPRYSTRQVVNLRSSGSQKSAVIKQLPADTVVKLVDLSGPVFNPDGMWEVHVPGVKGTGFVLGRLLRYGSAY